MAGFMEATDPGTAVVLDDCVLTKFENGRRSLLAHQEVDRLKVALGQARRDAILTTFLLESAADEALTAHREVETLTVEWNEAREVARWCHRGIERSARHACGDMSEWAWLEPTDEQDSGL